jgi:hypothetical protein
MFDLFLGGKPRHALDVGPVLPGAVKDHHLPGRGKMRDIAPGTYLRLLALGRRGERDDAENAGLSRSAIALIVPPLLAPSRP